MGGRHGLRTAMLRGPGSPGTALAPQGGKFKPRAGPAGGGWTDAEAQARPGLRDGVPAWCWPSGPVAAALESGPTAPTKSCGSARPVTQLRSCPRGRIPSTAPVSPPRGLRTVCEQRAFSRPEPRRRRGRRCPGPPVGGVEYYAAANTDARGSTERARLSHAAGHGKRHTRDGVSHAIPRERPEPARRLAEWRCEGTFPNAGNAPVSPRAPAGRALCEHPLSSSVRLCSPGCGICSRKLES